MKTAALLEKNKSKYFKLGLSDNEIKRKLRLVRGFRKIGLNLYFLPYNEENLDFLLDNKFELNGALTALLKADYEKKNKIKKIPKYKKRKLEVKKYQLEGVNFFEHLNGIAINADEMGLGKTVQALAWIQLRNDFKKILIICPSSLKDNWEDEIETWLTRKTRVQILEGKTPYKIKGDIVIINYDILSDWIVDLKLTDFDLVIADEIHYCKNPESQRTKAFVEITKSIPKRIGLTGTPIENDPVEIFHIVNLFNKNIFPNFIKFIQRYCGAKQEKQVIKGGTFVHEKQPDGTVKTHYKPKTRMVWKKGKYTNQAELHRILRKHIMIRRTKNDVDIDLPPKIYSTVKFRINNLPEYREAEEDFINYIKNEFDKKAEEELSAQVDGFDDVYVKDKRTVSEKLDAISRAPALSKIQTLKLLAAQGKMDSVIDWVNDFMETDEKLILFAVNKVIIKTLMDAFPFAVKIDGSVSRKKRTAAVKSFQNDPKCRLIILNIKAGGVGLTLTAASNVGIIQFPWNPGELLQAEDRAHRITQKKRVTIFKFVAKNTIEERIIRLLNAKQIEIDKIIDGKNFTAKSDIVKLLINSYK